MMLIIFALLVLFSLMALVVFVQPLEHECILAHYHSLNKSVCVDCGKEVFNQTAKIKHQH